MMILGFIILGILAFLLIWLFSSMLAMGLSLEMGLYWNIEDRLPNFHFLPFVNTLLAIFLIGVLIWRKMKNWYNYTVKQWFKKLKKYLPIKVHHIYYSYGWWYADKLFFFEKKIIPIIIVPMCMEFKKTTYANGKNIGGGTHSWDAEF